MMERGTRKISRSVLGILLLITLVLALPVFPQKTDLVYDLSLAQFRGIDSLKFVEFYFSIPLNQLVLVPKEDVYNIGFSVSLQALKDDSVFARSESRHPYTTEGGEEALQQSVLSVQNLYLPAGKFEITAEISDLFGDNSKKVSFPLNVEAVPEDSLYLSDIQLATLIQRDNKKTQFYKNGYKVLPNVLNVFGNNLPALFYYAEIYNFARSSADDTSSYVVQRRILDAEKKVVKSLPPKSRKKPGASAVELGRISVVSMKSGTYVFEIEVQDNSSSQNFKRVKKFFIYRPQDFTDSTRVSELAAGDDGSGLYPDSRYDTMTEKELDQEFETTKYIATKDEQNTYKKLNLDAKRKFILEFWGRRDPDINTKKNEFRDIYLSRVKYANEHFGGFKAGWKTDRGRVLLMYGEPDDIDRSPFSSETKPYQVWRYYSVQGGVEFVFVDKRNFGDLELVHSTARGELNDYQWSRWIDTMDQR